MRPFSFTKPTSLTAALSSKGQASQFIAGGTNLVDLMKKNIASPEELVDISSVLASTISRYDKGLRIGAMVKNSEIALNKEVLSDYPLLAKAILAGASPQIRNMASTGGNLLQRTRCPYFYDTTLPCNKRNPGSGCSALKGEQRMAAIIGYSEECIAVHPSDMCIALAALDANVNIRTKDNKQLTMAFRDFQRSPGTTPQIDNNLPANAIISSVEIPKNAFKEHYAYLKIRDRDSYAFALVSVAAAFTISNNKITAARLASGGVAHKPWRWYKSEEYLVGKEANSANFREAASIAVKETKPLSKNKFKALMLQGAIETALQNCLTA